MNELEEAIKKLEETQPIEVNSDRYFSLPYRARLICGEGGLLTGGVVAYLLNEVDDYKDIDIVVPVRLWNSISLPKNSLTLNINYFNGFTFQEDGIEYDVWPADIYQYLKTASKPGSKIRVYDANNNQLISTKATKKLVDSSADIPF
jgi:hypothetical protein